MWYKSLDFGPAAIQNESKFSVLKIVSYKQVPQLGLECQVSVLKQLLACLNYKLLERKLNQNGYQNC